MSYCRLCASLTNINDLIIVAKQSELRNKVLDYFQLDIHLLKPDSNKPTSVCKLCEQKVYNTSEFYEQIKRAQHFFDNEFLEIKEHISEEEDNGEEVEYLEDENEADLKDDVESCRWKCEPGTLFVCPECGETISNIDCFRQHLSFHRKTYKDRPSTDQSPKQQKSFSCKKCHKRFLKFSNLELHLRKHVKGFNNSYECDECSKKFASIYSLSNHKKTHTGIREHICEHCGKGFILKKYLNEHVMSHYDDRPYKCDLCPVAFKLKKYLRKHLFLHTGIKRFQCDICGKKFPRRPALVQHSITHSQDYPFKCDVCNKQFKMKRNFVGHQKTHTGEKPFSCNECNRMFGCLQSYDGHMEKYHGIIKVKKKLIEIKSS